LPSDLPSELIRWFQNVQRILDRLAQAAERQNQLDAMVERLVRENGELREEMDNLRRGERRSDAAIKRGDTGRA
jgi:regulator of replication initiation timing